MKPKQATEGITPDTHPDLILRREIDAGWHDDNGAIEAMRRTRASRGVTIAETLLRVLHAAPRMLSFPLPTRRGPGRPRKPMDGLLVKAAKWWNNRQRRMSHLKENARPAAQAVLKARGDFTAETVVQAKNELGPGASADDIAARSGWDVSTVRRHLKKPRE